VAIILIGAPGTGDVDKPAGATTGLDEGDTLAREAALFGGHFERQVMAARALPIPTLLEMLRLVDPRPGARHALLSRVYSDAVESGLLDESVELMATLVPGLRQILLTDVGGANVVQLVFADHSVPVALAGDGIQGLARMCFELALPAASTALLEEPEASQHPRAVRQSARAVVAAVRRGAQVILSTHSLELLDALLHEIGDQQSLLSLHHLALVDNQLRSTRYEGSEVAFAIRSLAGSEARETAAGDFEVCLPQPTHRRPT
jgi:hypothetical protein